MVRGDSHYGRDEAMGWCEETPGADYVFGFGERDPFAIGTASHREIARWLFWKGEDRPLRW